MSWQDYGAAPPPGTRICAPRDIDGAVALNVESAAGRLPVLLVRSAAGLRAYVNACPHQYLPLDYRGARVLSADGLSLVCTAHGARFDAATGASLAGAPCGLDPLPMVERDGQLWIG